MKTIKLTCQLVYPDEGTLCYKEYFFEGKRHNPEGPAYESYWGDGSLRNNEYWIEGKKLTKEQFDKRKNSQASLDGKIAKIDGKTYKLVEVK